MKFNVVRNDITNMQVDAIVLPANPKLKEGSGVSKQVFEKAGRKYLEQACKKYGKVETGEAIHTLGFSLSAKYIIHTVVPKWKENKDEYELFQLLSESYFSALKLADDIGCVSIAIPLLASGHQGFTPKDSFEIAKQSIDAFLANNKLEKVILVVYDKDAMSVMREQKIFVEELIDEEYVLTNDENYEPIIKRALYRGKETTQRAVEKGVSVAKEQINNPENHEKMIAAAVAAAKFVTDEKNRAKVKKVAEGVVKVATKLVKK